MDSSHVGFLSILFMCLTLLVCVGVPVALAVWANRKYGKAFSLIPLAAGLLGFFLSQEVLRLPVLQYVLPLFGWFKDLMQMQWPYLLFMCFTAGLVEEPARFVAFAILKKRRSYPDGLSYGIGHGGIEAAVIVGLSYVANLFASLAINLGPAGSAVAAATAASLTGTPSYLFLVAGLERVMTMTLQIALSLVVLRGFQTRKRTLYLLVAFLLHGTANFATLAAGRLGASAMAGNPQLGFVIFSEGVLLVVAVLSVLYIVRQARAWKKGEGLGNGGRDETVLAENPV